MRLDSLRVELRPRSPWEAMELGTALVRAHAGAIWKPWLLLSLPVFALLNATALAIGLPWLAGLAMWWLLPVFDRVALLVLSRAVFGDAPGVRETIAAQRNWGWRAMLGHLTWRRISLWRALTLPVDLLEGTEPARLRERRRVLGDAVRGHAAMLTITCVLFLVALELSLLSLVLLFVPWEFLSEAARAVWSLLFVNPPAWAEVLMNAAWWAAVSLIEPFYIGAGFGLYLNRRTQIEAWDVEIAFRRMRARLASAATALLLVVAVALALPLPAHAQAGIPRAPVEQDAQDAAAAAKDGNCDCDADDLRNVIQLDEIFGKQRVDAATFADAVGKAYVDPLLRPKRKQMQWQRRNQQPDQPLQQQPLVFEWLSKAIGFVAEFGLWLLLAVLVAVLALTAKRWLPWLRGGVNARDEASTVDVSDATLPDVLPEDIAAAVRRLWREGRRRRALALLYRASVEAMAVRAGVTLVPGATESQCLRASRRMPEAVDRDAFARAVRVWQYAAYAQRMPDEAAFESLLGELSQRFGWAP